MNLLATLLAQAATKATTSTASQTAAQSTFEFGRIQSEVDWILPVLLLLALLAYAAYMVWRDTRELGGLAAVMLLSLRATALLGLFVVYLQPQWRNERKVVHNSRVLLLVDTSLSMETDDNDASPAEPNRAERVVAVLADNKLLAELRRVHDVVVLRFDRDLGRVVSLDKLKALDPAGSATDDKAKISTQAATESLPDWREALAPRGTETRLGQALKQALDDERSAPLAGVVVFTDGRQNSGVEPAVALAMAREAGVPIYPIGLGSDRVPVNVRIREFAAPARAYPGDKFSVTGSIEGQGLAGKTISVELLSRAGGAATGATDDSSARIEGTEQVTLGADGEAASVKFELTPSEIGRRTFSLVVKAPTEDRNREDNRREASVEIVDHKTRVLLFSGAASREYQFLCTRLKREKEMSVDVLLQTGSEGVSQDATAVLDDFPTTREALFAYDCIVAIDPDWRELDKLQIDLLEQFVADQAGGLIVAAGPIFTDAWTQAANLGQVRNLYPVEFNRRFAIADDAHHGSKEPWPLELTRDGLESPFLWLGDSATSSAAAWAEFPGVYGYHAVRSVKPGARVLARFSDPRARSGDQQPPYLVTQSFGSGRVFYMGSAELWRLRGVRDNYFETLYIKLIRHVSQARLLRGSNRGLVQTERDQYLPGQTVDVRARLTNAQLEPLTLSSVPLQVVVPGGTLQTVKLAADPAREGNYRGQFTVRKEGSYLIELPIPESKEPPLSCPPIQVTIPNLERDEVRRNDALLSELARQTGGVYFVGLDAMLGHKTNVEPLWTVLRDKSRTLTLAAAPLRLLDDHKSWYGGRIMLVLLCGVLCLEWLLRRLMKLA